jgi:hypothetical protein
MPCLNIKLGFKHDIRLLIKRSPKESPIKISFKSPDKLNCDLAKLVNRLGLMFPAGTIDNKEEAKI